MSEQAPIDAVKFARERGRLQGEMAVASMERLHDLVARSAGHVRYRIEGSISARRKPVVDVQVDVVVPLTCQRCLEIFDYELKRTARFEIVERAEDLPDVADEDPETETMTADALADVADLVEQEVLLGLPIAPMHPAGDCGEAPKSGANERPSPFAVLEQLKRK